MNSPSSDDTFVNQLTGEESEYALNNLLEDHVERTAERARAALDGPLTTANVGFFLNDERCLRYPTEIVYTSEGLEANQFAEPYFEEVDGKKRCRLYVHPRFEERPDTLPVFLAYMAPVINYGHIVSPDICERYGALLMGISEEAFYASVCDAFDAGC